MRMPSILCSVVLLVAAGLASAQNADLPSIEESACPFPVETLDIVCGYLLVAEDRTDPDSAILALAIAAIPAANGNPLPDPIIYLEGGPGGSALYAAQDYQNHPLREDRDLILLDQRGTGFSFPSLNCIEMEADTDVTESTAACFERLRSEGIDLNAYHSAASAADVNDLRIALGYDAVNLWGISYGTRLALTVLRDHPEGVRAVVLDSVYPPEIDAQATSVAATLAALHELFARCAEDPYCSSAYPNLEADFFAMIDRFNQDPPTFVDYDGSELTIAGDVLLDGLFQTLYDSATIPMLPYGITLLANATDDLAALDGYDILHGAWTTESWTEGETGIAEESIFESDLVLSYLEEIGDISDSEGAYLSVECSEEVPFNDVQAAYDAIESDAPATLQAWLYSSVDIPFMDCAIWPVERRSLVETEPVASDIPVLLVSGRFDPITPPSYADSALRTLGQGRHIVFPTGSHGGTGTPGCAANLAKAFFDAPAEALDTSCIPEFVDWYVEP